MSGVIIRDQSKKSAQPATQSPQNDVIESVFSKRSVSQSSEPIIMQAMQKMMQQMLQSQQEIIERLNALKVRSNDSFVSASSLVIVSSVSASSVVISFALVPSPIASPTTENRWRIEDIGTFDSTSDNVHFFVNRIRDIAALKGNRVVQTNLITCLKEAAID